MSEPGNLQRVRLSEWARQQGISRITAYRMLKRGILPVPSERSPTGRWYVLIPSRQRSIQTALYARATPGPRQVEIINRQLAVLSEWSAVRHRSVFTVVREISEPLVSSMPRLERLLSDRQITEIVIATPRVVGINHYPLLVAALSPQGRTVTAVRSEATRDDDHQDELYVAIAGLCKLAYGQEDGLKAAHRIFTTPDGAA